MLFQLKQLYRSWFERVTMIVGYSRTSTQDQLAGLEAQIKELEQARCEKIYQEQVSSVVNREQLESALDFMRDGDVFVVTKLDRLARSIRDLMNLLDKLAQKKVAVKILNLGLDTQSPTGTLILNVLGCVAQFEREMMLERQRDGIAKAKSEGKYKGRKSISDEKKAEIVRLVEEGFTKRLVAKQVGVEEATVYRVLVEEKNRAIE